jgi:uncharacterized protein (TIGR02118 family)
LLTTPPPSRAFAPRRGGAQGLILGIPAFPAAQRGRRRLRCSSGRIICLALPAKKIQLEERKEKLMAVLFACYKTPADAAAFDSYYAATHIPIAKKIPGLRKYNISAGPIMTPDGPSSYHLIAVLHFDDMAAMQAAFASPEGQATAADLPKFATGGIDMFMSEMHEV